MAPPTAPEPGSLSALLADLAHVPEVRPDEAWVPALRTGDQVGGYQLRAELGRGSFGVVFEARDVERQRPVAFKVVRPGKMAVGEAQLQHEADTIGRLCHPNLVALHEVGRCHAGPYLVLELLRGATLKARLAEGPIPPADALRVALDVARGLAHAHGRGVVHRDLKPSNVFLCDDGTLRVLDFGLAHAFGRRRIDGGTPDFMAPEQWRGAPEDERTDVFALGVLLYRMLAGELPFPDDGGRSATSARPAPRLEVPDLPGLGPLVAATLSKDPVDRPRDAGAVVEALEALRGAESSGASSSGTGTSGGSVRIRRRARRRVTLAAALGAGALLAVLLVGATLAVRQRREAVLAGAAPAAAAGPDAGEAAPPPSVAVLPFEDLSPAHDQEHFGEGLAEEIMNALAQTEGLKVAGRLSSFRFRGRGGDLSAIQRQLGVGAVLQGSVRIDGNHVRVSAQLVKTADGYQLWNQTFDRELTGVFAVQDQIAAAVVEALKVKLLGGRARATRELRTASPAAYSQFLLGRSYQRKDTTPNLALAEQAYQRAVDLDPAYAPAWAGLAIATFWVRGNSGPTREAMTRGQAEALAAAERAVALAPDLADGYAARAFLRFSLHRDWAGAQADMDRALALNPNDADVQWSYGLHVLGPLGRVGPALAAARRASELDPLSPSPWNALAWLYLSSGQLALARHTALRSLELLPVQETAVIDLAYVDLLEGKPAAALTSIARSQDPIFRLQFAAMARHDLGQPREAAAALATLVKDHGHEAPFQIASALAWRGDVDLAFTWLDRAVAVNDGGIGDLKLDPLLRSLRGDPRYRALLERLKLPVD